MTEIVMHVPDQLAQRLRPMSLWLPALLELGLAGFKTPTAQTAAELVAFLSTGPQPVDVLHYQVSERAQERLRRLLALNAGGALSVDEQAELDEIEQLEHFMIMLKAQAQEHIMRGA
jgi:hypothetical protein